MKLICFYFLVFLVGFSACSSQSKPERKPVTNIQITPSNKTVIQGNEFSIDITSRVDNPKIEKIDVFLNNELIKTSNSESFSIKVNSSEYLPGIYSVKTIATNAKGETGTHYNTISILSNIQPKNLSYRIIETIPHNTSYFTQGLEFHNGILYEGTGNYGQSYVYAYLPNEGGKVLNQLKLDDRYFGEGITILNDKIYQLTYKSRKGFVYDVHTFEKLNEFSFQSDEGWGLCNDGTYLIMSDGTSKLSYLNPDNFEVVKTIEVSTPTGFVRNVNELEYVDGNIYANIWTTNTIVKFEAKTGKVLAFINMNNLLNMLDLRRADVFNGIAYNEEEDLFYVTGKLWPQMFKVKFE